MEKNLIDELLIHVKDNKKYRSISDDIVNSEIENYLKKNPRITKIDKISIKEIRKGLHRLYSSYQTRKKNKGEDYLKELSSSKTNNDILRSTEKLLGMTLSTKERLKDYKEIYKKIFNSSMDPKTIVDIGCGFNPLSYPLMKIKELY